MKNVLGAFALTLGLVGTGYAAPSPHTTIVLVHGAFADASSWNAVSTILKKDGYEVIAAANPLRSVKTDAAAVGALVSSIKNPVVLVGHSYGGNVISEAASDRANVKALVYVSAFSPDTGENAADLSAKFPGSTLGPTLAEPVELAGGDKDLYIQQAKFHEQFAADVSAKDSSLMAVNQRPVTETALHEKTVNAGWKKIPSWHIYGDQDKNIPPQAMAFMAQRAESKGTVVVKGGSHVVMVSHPAEVAKVIEAAAKTVK
ncbi:alpha/beta fold hydrolase [Pseudomonas abietaniphila]